ncbi:MAG: amidohydrolase family protein [Pseudomonadota bacterium]
MKIIDPHLHFFDLEHGDYKWLDIENPPHWPLKHTINRNFDESSIILSSSLEIAGYVHIEAGYNNQQSWEEVALWQKKATLPFRAIQCADLTEHPEIFRMGLACGLNNTSLVGVRHIIDDYNVLSHVNFLENLQLLAKLNLIFELQCDLRCVDTTNALMNALENVPNLSVSLNHLGFIPAQNTQPYQHWLSHFKALIQHRHLGIKVSGLEMRQSDVTPDDIARTLDPCLTEASIDSIMMASNFPIVTFVNSYQGYWQTVINVIDRLGVKTDLLVAENAFQQYFARQIKPLS